jgi:hypothetical protein
LKRDKTLSRSTADEQIFEEIAAIVQLFDCDPQFVTVSGIEFAHLPRFARCLLGSARKNFRSKPFDGAALTAPMLGPVVLKPLQRVEEKRTITRRIDAAFARSNAAARREGFDRCTPVRTKALPA